MSPQCQTIFDHLLRGGTLTALEATRPPFNTTCLHKRLSEIEATGVVIDSVWETDGKKRWKRYSYHLITQEQVKPEHLQTYLTNEYGWPA